MPIDATDAGFEMGTKLHGLVSNVLNFMGKWLWQLVLFFIFLICVAWGFLVGSPKKRS